MASSLVSPSDNGSFTAGFGPNMAWAQINLYYFLIALFVHRFLSPLDAAAAAHAAGAHGLLDVAHAGWAGLVLARNLVLGNLIYGLWHHLMYVKFSVPVEDKFNKRLPSEQQHRRDAFWSNSGFVIASLFEIGMTHLYASGRIAHYHGLADHPLRTAALLVGAWVWSDLHFYFVHRMMHPTFPGKKGKSPIGVDPGRILYNCAHYLHHRSYNPGPWSGLAMHPIEHLLYFTRGVSACLATYHHPAIFMFYNLRAMLGPAPGHHGFPGMGGSRYHWLHHATFECNYGTSMVVPMDHIMGTFKEG
jgi:sterol desaturase/sphingolipid hydroxylase (fatty acid hydroxylase superfamily)